MDVVHLASILLENSELHGSFDYEAITKYIDLVWLLKPTISATQASYHPEPPSTLPVNVHDFLKLCLRMTDHVGKLAWECFHSLAWDFVPSKDLELASCMKYIKLFLDHGISCKIGMSFVLFLQIHTNLAP